MSVRKKLTEMESTSAFVVGGGLALIILGFLLSAAQAGAGFDASRLNIVMIIGASFMVAGIILWVFVTQPWKNFDDWSTPLYTGHDAHHTEEAAVEAETADLATIGVHPVVHEPGHPVVASDEADRTDDLENTIDGIGPKIATVLRSVGILTFADLAKREPEELERIIRDSGVRMVGHTNTWIEQARMAAEGRWAELEQYQHNLRTRQNPEHH